MKYLICLLMALPVFSFAEDTSSNLGTEVPTAPEAVPAFPQPGTQKFIFGLQTVDFDYREPDLMSDRGWLSGFNFQYHRVLSATNTLKVSADYLQGSVAYDGFLMSTVGVKTPYQSTEKFRVMNLEVIFGGPLSDSSIWGVTTGGGYRNTYDYKTGPYDYTRDISYYYLIVGLNAQIYNKGKVRSVASAELSSLLGGGAKTHLSDVSSSYRDVDLTFQAGTALKLGVETTLPVLTDKEIVVDLSYKYWSVADSKSQYAGNGEYYIEPHNTTGLTSLSIGYVF